MDFLEQFLQKNRKVILIISAVIITGVIGYNIIVMISRIGKIPVTIMYAPFDAEVKINGKAYRNNQKHYLDPGDYQVEVSREHFQTMTLNYTLTSGTDENYFIGGLSPSDDEGYAISKEHSREFNLVESIGSIEAENEAKKLFESAPIAQYLPINFNMYSISYSQNETGNFFIELILKGGIEYSPSAIATLYRINNGDVDPAQYDIVVRDYKDPFKKFTPNTESDPIKYLATGYGSSFMDYKVLENRVVKQDDYYGVLIIPSNIDLSDNNATYPTYRAILKKDDAGWKLITSPYPIVSQYNAAGVPTDFLNKLNRTFVELDI